MTSKKGHIQVLHNIVWHSSEKALRMLIGFFVGLWLARYLAPEQFGRFNYISSWLGMFEAIAWLGVGDNMLRDIVRDRQDENRIMGSAFMIRLCGSLIAIALTLGTAGPLGEIKGSDLMLLAILSIGLPFAQTTGGIWIWFASHTNIGPAVLTKNVAMIIGAFLRIGVIIFDAGLVGLMTALTLEYVFWWFFIFGIYVWQGESFLRWRFNIRHAWQMLLTGLPIILSALVASLNQRVDQIMLGRLTTMTDVGVYAAAMRFSEIWWIVPPIIVQSLSSRYIFSNNVGELLNRNIARIIVGMVILSLVPCFFMSLIGSEVIGLFLGKEYSGSASVLMIHIWTAVVIFIDAPVNQYLLATYRQSQLVIKSVVLLFLNFGMTLILVPRYGVQGAAIATLVAESATVLVLPAIYRPLRDVCGVYGLAIREARPLSIIAYHYALNLFGPLLSFSKSLMSFKTQKSHDFFPNNTLRSYSIFSSLALIFGVGVCSVFMGLLAATADPVKIGLGVSLILGSALLVMPETTIWLILIIGFLFGVLSANPLFSKITWGVSLLSMLLLIPSLLNILWSKYRRPPDFMLIALLFLIYSIGVSMIQCYSIPEFVAGFKRYFQSFGLMMALTMIVFSPQSYVRWQKFLIVVALMQFPFALYELLVLVPLRGGLELSSYTTDVVAGTFGANLEGGSPNSVMVIYLFVSLSFLVARWRAGVLQSKIFYPLAFICLLPFGMGETKVVVIMLPIIGVILLKDDFLRAPLRYFPAFLTLLLLTLLIGYIYVSIMLKTTVEEAVMGTIKYNAGDMSYSGLAGELNRWTSVTFWFQEQGWYDPIGFLIGNGLGSSYHAIDLGTVGGHIGMKYLHSSINLTSASTLLWDTGVIGFILFLSIFVAAWKAASRLYESVRDPVVKADTLAIKAAISLFLLSVMYSDSIVNLVSMELIYAIVLGYLGYLMNCYGYLKQRFTSAPSPNLSKNVMDTKESHQLF